LSEATRRRYFTADERKFIRCYGAKLDEIACMRASPANDDELHLLQVCQRQAEPRNPRERLWLYAQLVCRYERSLQRAARTDLVEYENDALRIENRALRSDLKSLERVYMEVLTELKMERGQETLKRPIGNLVWMTHRFHMSTPSPNWTMFAYGQCH
jgi:uncharacterized protein YifE (UPF0438 family)